MKSELSNKYEILPGAVYTAEQAAVLLCFASKRTVLRLVTDRKLVPLQTHGGLRFLGRELNRYLDSVCHFKDGSNDLK